MDTRFKHRITGLVAGAVIIVVALVCATVLILNGEGNLGFVILFLGTVAGSLFPYSTHLPT